MPKLIQNYYTIFVSTHSIFIQSVFFFFLVFNAINLLPRQYLIFYLSLRIICNNAINIKER